MRPSAVEIIRSIQFSFEKYILPELQDPQAKSAAAGIRNLLDHLELRVEREASSLREDNEEKRKLFLELADRLGHVLSSRNIPDLEKMKHELEASAEKNGSGEFPTVRLLTLENEELKAILDRAISVLHAHGMEIGAGVFDELKRSIYSQLHRQLDRESMGQTLVSRSF